MKIISPLSAGKSYSINLYFFLLPIAIVLVGAFVIVRLNLLPPASSVVADSANSPAPSQGKPYDLPDVDNYFNIPYFINSEKMASTLVLNNNLPIKAEAEVTLFNLQGESLKLPSFSLQPFSAERFNLAELTSEAEGDFSSGNVQIFYHAPMMSITSQITVASTSKRISFESNESSAMDFHSNKLYGIMWLPDDETKAEAALTNTATSPITVVAEAGGKIQTVTLGSRETRIINLREFAPKVSRSPQSALLTLEHNGTPGALIATGFAYNEKNGFSTNLPFAERVATKAKLLAGAHFKFGPATNSEEFPEGTNFEAPLVMANMDDLPIVAKPAVDYTVNGISNRVSLGSIKIEPKQTKQIDLERELARLNLNEPVDDAGIEITYTGKPGALMARLTSLDKTGDFVFDTPIKDPLAGAFRVSGNYPWRLDEGYNTVVHLKNTINKEAYAIVQIRYDGGDYNPDRIKLEPYQTIALDIRKLRDAQEKDIRGGVMPMDVTNGQIIWYERTKESLIGRAETFVVANGLSSSFSCGGGGNCISFHNSEMNPPSITTVAGSGGISYVPKYKERDCFNHTYGPYTVTGMISWSSTEESVADANGGSVIPISGGTTTILASWSTQAESCGTSCNPHPILVSAGGVLVVKPNVIMITTPNGGGARAVQGFGTIAVTIKGTGFGTVKNNVSVMVAGTGITAEVDSVIPTTILASFTIAANADPGDHAVIVKVRNQSSASKNFFVQIPTRLIRENFQGATNGIGPLVVITNGDVKDLSGNILLSNRCGVYRNIAYRLVDQSNPPNPIIIDSYLLTESFDTYSSTIPGATAPSDLARNVSGLSIANDTLYIGNPAPNCLGSDHHEAMNQHFTVRIGNKDYVLTTVVRIERGNYSGTAKVDTSFVSQ
jgi:hypothetical protein